MHTFSQMVDEIVSETKRPDLVSEIARYLNETIREMHFTEDRGAVLQFRENFHEALLTADVESGFMWEIPSPTTFQKMAGVKFVDVYDDDGESIWAEETTPGRHLNGKCHFFYRVAGTFVFAGFGGVNSSVAIGWLEFPRSLKYKSAGARPAEFDIESGWTYAAGLDTEEEQLGARELVTNWILLRWSDVVAEGLRAKVYKRLSDDSRARTCYSLYQSLRHGFWTSEAF